MACQPRFSQFQKSLGIAKNILADRLRALVEQGILTQRSNDGGTRSHYLLTERGRDLFTILLGLRQWGERNAFGPGEQHSVLVENATGTPVPPLRPASTAGTELDAATTHVRKVNP
ncbi:helix-turn-helix domain-containing protein [Micrococcaceae bacterium Sec5.7]